MDISEAIEIAILVKEDDIALPLAPPEDDKSRRPGASVFSDAKRAVPETDSSFTDVS